MNERVETLRADTLRARLIPASKARWEARYLKMIKPKVTLGQKRIEPMTDRERNYANYMKGLQ